KMEKVKNILLSQDKFGTNIVFSFKKNSQHNTLFGGIFSILINATYIFVTYFFAQELWDKKQPNTVISEEVILQPERFNITKESYTIAFGIQDRDWNHFVDESIYKIEAIQNTMIKKINPKTGISEQEWNSYSLDARKCTDQDKNNFKVSGTQEYFKNLAGIENMYCLNMDKYIYIEGDFQADAFATLEFSIKICNQNDTSQKCSSQQKIDQLLEYSVFAAYFTDKIINPTNLYQPFTNIAKDMFWPISNKIGKEITIYMRNYYIESDIGVISSDVIVQQNALFQYQTEQTLFKGKLEGEFVRFVIRFEKGKQSRYYRSYKKIQDVLANVSGVTDLLMVIGAIICIPFSQLDLNKELVNEVYSFEKTNEELQNEQSQQQQMGQKGQESPNIQEIVRMITTSKHKQQNSNNGVELNQDNVNFPQSPNIEKLKNESKQLNQSMFLKKNQSEEILSNIIKSYKKNEKRDSKIDIQIEKLFKVFLNKYFFYIHLNQVNKR
ncbi:hypothetical protein IMG5_129090, partial [Ichthyophthirius multifiliis]